MHGLLLHKRANEPPSLFLRRRFFSKRSDAVVAFFASSQPYRKMFFAQNTPHFSICAICYRTVSNISYEHADGPCYIVVFAFSSLFMSR